MNWDSIKDIAGKAAPLLGTLLGGPAGATVGTLVASALGTSADPTSVATALKDPDKQAELQRWAYEHEEKLQEIAFSTASVELADKQHAREINKHSKMPAAIVIILTTLITCIVGLLFKIDLPTGNADIAFYLIGQVSALWGAAVTYWVGTTRSSAEKNFWKK